MAYRGKRWSDREGKALIAAAIIVIIFTAGCAHDVFYTVACDVRVIEKKAATDFSHYVLEVLDCSGFQKPDQSPSITDYGSQIQGELGNDRFVGARLNESLEVGETYRVIFREASLPPRGYYYRPQLISSEGSSHDVASQIFAEELKGEKIKATWEMVKMATVVLSFFGFLILSIALSAIFSLSLLFKKLRGRTRLMRRPPRTWGRYSVFATTATLFFFLYFLLALHRVGIFNSPTTLVPDLLFPVIIGAVYALYRLAYLAVPKSDAENITSRRV